MNTVFNQVVDSVYLKATGNRTIADSLKKKALVIYDSLTTDKPGYVEFKARFTTIKNLYFDTISEKVTPKIDLNLLQKKANFDYRNGLSLNKGPFPSTFWNSNYALPGFLLFSKINFDEERKFGEFHCTYTNGDMYKAKYFLIYIQKENNEWKLKDVMLRNMLF
ncbi:hypothetical protein ACFPVY_07280 [Flavobacterium qiangtangense]|uniref:DUF3828 domain-containing protein n=1 Tax=Flavobacterium qiangtangense TaxID=1442595 RepID=A0ABW1PNF0_9FLAO